LYDLAALAILLPGLTLALLLAFAKRPGQKANLFLSLALTVAILKAGGLTPLFLPALGPLLYLYVQQLTYPGRQHGRKDLLHFCQLLAAFWLPAWLVLLLVITYLYLSHRLIEDFYCSLRPVLMDRPRFAFRRLSRALLLLGSFCVLSLFNHTFYLALAAVLIAMAADAVLKPDSSATVSMPTTDRYGAKEKARRLKEAVAANRLYEDAGLTLTTLAEKLKMHPHDLSRIINVGFEKNFNDFINEFRVREIVVKMQDPAYDHITLMGIAYDAGFNSKTTFNRVFKEMVGKTPTEYKNGVKKDVPIDKLTPRPHVRPVILRLESPPIWAAEKLKRKYMFRNYLKIAWRNLARNKTSSFINIGGLAIGMAVAMLIGLWIWDELSFNKYHQNYDRIAQVMRNRTANGDIQTMNGLPIPLAAELKVNYGNHFKYLVLSSHAQSHLVAVGEKQLAKNGRFMEAAAPEMLTLTMLKGTRAGLKQPGSILLSSSLARALFGDADPMGKLVKLDAKVVVKVTGVYENLPYNTSFNNLSFLAPWDLYVAEYDWPKQAKDGWGYNGFEIYAQAAGQEDVAAISKAIKNTILHKFGTFSGDPQLFLQPMSRWRLYSEFKNGVNAGGRVQYVWLFGIIGAFVLLLACINFMNLSTARSEKRAKEVGIRKAMGSWRGQLIGQFFCESFLATGLACLLSILLVQLSLPYFNDLADKKMAILWGNPLFWIFIIGFVLLTGLVAGSYPAFYLSSFKPIKVLKGVFKAGRFAALPRRVLVVLQFTISISLIIGTLIVFRQVQFATNRPVGYNREGLFMLQTLTTTLPEHFAAFSDDLLKTGAVAGVAESNSPATDVWDNRSGYEWQGKDPNLIADFATIAVSKSYGKTVGWQFEEGRDFSDAFLSDSSAIILNETAVKFTGLKHPVGATISVGDYKMHVIGVIKDMVMQSPYEPVKQTMFYLDKGTVINVKIKPGLSANEALAKIGAVFKKYVPAEPFNYQFIDEDYATKFDNEQRIGKLAASFATLAILISCIGLFGMASYTAEQRVKEIGVRKVLGASVFNLWRLLSRDFVIMVIISLFIAIPIAWWVMHNWLQNYTYRADLSWWVFAVSGLGALVITLLTVSYQSIKAALANPVKSLRSE